MSVIELNGLTKDYGEGRGIFNVNLSIEEGEMTGFVGTNGSGKTTTIRSILGFIKPTRGTAYVNGLVSWEHAGKIAKYIGYVPGGNSFSRFKNGYGISKKPSRIFRRKRYDASKQTYRKSSTRSERKLKKNEQGYEAKNGACSRAYERRTRDNIRRTDHGARSTYASNLFRHYKRRTQTRQNGFNEQPQF